jgi:hypothetical protein
VAVLDRLPRPAVADFDTRESSIIGEARLGLARALAMAGNEAHLRSARKDARPDRVHRQPLVEAGSGLHLPNRDHIEY